MSWVRFPHPALDSVRIDGWVDDRTLTPVRVDLGDGDDVANLGASAIAYTVLGGPGNDAIQVGNGDHVFDPGERILDLDGDGNIEAVELAVLDRDGDGVIEWGPETDLNNDGNYTNDGWTANAELAAIGLPVDDDSNPMTADVVPPYPGENTLRTEMHIPPRITHRI